MSVIIIHGEQIDKARSKLVEFVQLARQQGKEVVTIPATTITEASLEEAFGSQDLFATPKMIVIEELNSLPTSNKKKAFIQKISEYIAEISNTNNQNQNLNNTQNDLILFEKRTLTATMLKPFVSPKAKTSGVPAEVFEFKVSKSTFTWLEMLGSRETPEKKLKLLHQAIDEEGEFFCFLMLVRQIKMLLQIKEGVAIKGAPFMIAKAEKQAQNFDKAKLVQIYKKMLDIDLLQKTSQTKATLIQMLDLLTLTM